MDSFYIDPPDFLISPPKPKEKSKLAEDKKKKKAVNPTPQDPIYDQANSAIISQPQLDDTNNPSGLLQYNTYVLKNPQLLLSSPKFATDDLKQNLPNHGDVEAGNNAEKKDSDPSVFSISGRRVVVSGGWNEKEDKEKEDECSNVCLGTIWGSNKDRKIKWNKTKLQLCTEYFSLFLFVPGCFLIVLTPWLLVPVYLLPSLAESSFYSFVYLSFFLSIILTVLGCIFGNIVWYKKDNKWRCMLHCGDGPRNHYWGDSFASKPVETV